MDLLDHWIGGKAHHPDTDRYGEVTNSATGQVCARVPLAGSKEVELAVSAARAAFDSWRTVSLARRAQLLFAFRSILDKRRDEVARVVVREHGKVFEDARGEVARALDVVDFACGIPQLLKGEHSVNVSSNLDCYSVRQAVGVVAGITPFNFPAMVPLWMIPLAIGCGNTFVLKPSEKDPSVSMLLAAMFAEAGLPDGVLNVVHGDKEAVDALLTHPGIDAVSFVGSTPIARYVYETATGSGKRVQAFGGAKNHAVVLPDADLEATADALTSAGYGSAGERCMAISTVIAVGNVGDRLVDLLSERSESINTGPGEAADSQMGPLITAEHRDRVVECVVVGVDEGAKLVVDGRGLKVDGHENGYFLGPCLFDHVTPEMSVYTKEIFGPVLVVVRVDSFDSAVELINANPYGNGTAIFTNDGGAAREFQERVNVGMVGVNVPIPVPMSYHSFGGWKDSMFGEQRLYGPEGVSFYTRGKVMSVRWPDPHNRQGVNLGFPVST